MGVQTWRIPNFQPCMGDFVSDQPHNRDQYDRHQLSPLYHNSQLPRCTQNLAPPLQPRGSRDNLPQ